MTVSYVFGVEFLAVAVAFDGFLIFKAVVECICEVQVILWSVGMDLYGFEVCLDAFGVVVKIKESFTKIEPITCIQWIYFYSLFILFCRLLISLEIKIAKAQLIDGLVVIVLYVD